MSATIVLARIAMNAATVLAEATMNAGMVLARIAMVILAMIALNAKVAQKKSDCLQNSSIPSAIPYSLCDPCNHCE